MTIKKNKKKRLRVRGNGERKIKNRKIKVNKKQLRFFDQLKNNRLCKIDAMCKNIFVQN